ncbi:hypothetical protein H9X89_16380, partial [Faecalicatena contorta]|uniref:hypothetical protein n=1 Tax=Faecalicatena contorta TaxID=39482 RepID=UPI0019616EE7
RSAIERVVGIIIIDDDLVEACRVNVRARCELVDVSKYRRRQAQEEYEAVARRAIVDTFCERTGAHHQVGRNWPGAHAIIKGSRALVDID